MSSSRYISSGLKKSLHLGNCVKMVQKLLVWKAQFFICLVKFSFKNELISGQNDRMGIIVEPVNRYLAFLSLERLFSLSKPRFFAAPLRAYSNRKAEFWEASWSLSSLGLTIVESNGVFQKNDCFKRIIINTSSWRDKTYQNGLYHCSRAWQRLL